MKRRRGSVLIISLIVMLVLTILSGAMFGFSYINYRSAEQLQGMFRARAAADSLLRSVGLTLVYDRVTELKQGVAYKADFEDGPVRVRMTVMTNDPPQDCRSFLLECTAHYGDWTSGKRRLEIARRWWDNKKQADKNEYEWIWR